MDAVDQRMRMAWRTKLPTTDGNDKVIHDATLMTQFQPQMDTDEHRQDMREAAWMNHYQPQMDTNEHR
jgi:hypothetical protein